MDKDLLKAAYSPEDFRKRGHELVDQLADHLDQQLHEKAERTLHWHLPEEELVFWTNFLKNGDDRELFPEILKRTTNVHNPKCIGHQVTPPAPITALSGMVSSLLNNGMAVYEMGMAPSAMERIVTDLLCNKIGYDANARGFLTSGGTLANLTALLSARKAVRKEDIWHLGHGHALGIMVSEEAHYCVDRAAKIMGLGEKGIIKIQTRKNYSMDISRLEQAYRKATDDGIQIFAIVGSAPSTATGAYDDLAGVARFAKQHALWFHVDGAHGGAAIFSKKYAHLVAGIDQADSVVIDGHKMMMMPTITTALLFKNGKHASATFSQKADYLLTQTDHEDWYNSGKRTFECTKIMMSVHWYILLKSYGEGIFNEYINQLYDLGHVFGDILEKDPNFELAARPTCNIICFRYVDISMDNFALNKLNENIRQSLLEEGEFYIVQTKLRGVHYLRTTIMNPFTERKHLDRLMEKIREKAKNVKK